MPLNIGSSGESKPFVKYNAKADKWFVRQGDQDVEIARPTFVADLANLRTGWFLYLENTAPNIVFDVNLSTPAAKPSESHKRGFRVDLFSKAAFGGVVEFTSASMYVCNAIAELYVKYEAEVGANAGKVPVVECTGSVPQKGSYGTNYQPVFTIQKWVDRPAELPGSVQSAPAAANVNPAPAPVKAAVSEF